MKLLSTRAHGALDYLAVILVFALPRLLGWGPGLTHWMTIAAAGALAYSLLTRYELGLIGLFEIGASLLTRTRSSVGGEPQPAGGGARSYPA